MANKIVFGTKSIIVNNAYAFRYSEHRTVLRIDVADVSATFDDIMLLKANTLPIQYFEDEVLKMSYEDYTGECTVMYSSGVYSIELTKLSDTDLAIKKNADDINTVWAAVDVLFTEVIPTLQ